MQTKNFNLIVILGATATGKTSLAVHCAKEFFGEIISADSRQVYKELNIGSGKDLNEYGNIKYHLIDICDLNSEYNVFNFQNDCNLAFDKIAIQNKLPIIAGGTGLYLNSILSNYNLQKVPTNVKLRNELKNLSQDELSKILLQLNPNLHNKTDLTIRDRTIRAIEIATHKSKNPNPKVENKIKPLIFQIIFERNILRKRILNRLTERLKQGLIEEVEYCIQTYGSERILRLGLEYKFTTLFLKGVYNYNEYFQKLYTSICQFAKRQETWFRKMKRDGVKIINLDGSDKLAMFKTITEKMHES